MLKPSKTCDETRGSEAEANSGKQLRPTAARQSRWQLAPIQARLRQRLGMRNGQVRPKQIWPTQPRLAAERQSGWQLEQLKRGRMKPRHARGEAEVNLRKQLRPAAARQSKRQLGLAQARLHPRHAVKGRSESRKNCRDQLQRGESRKNCRDQLQRGRGESRKTAETSFSEAKAGKTQPGK
jgi:hypothetical protein